MLAFGTGVSGCGNHNHSLLNRLFGRLADDAPGALNIFIASQRNVQHPNVETITVLDHPFDAARDIVFGDSAQRAGLNQNDLGSRRQPAIDTVAMRAVTGSDDGRLRAVPLPWLDRIVRTKRRTFSRQIMVSNDPIIGLAQISMWI